MRRIALLSLSLTLSGCGYQTWWNLPFTAGSNPNMPVSDSENMRRVQGQESAVEPMRRNTVCVAEPQQRQFHATGQRATGSHDPADRATAFQLCRATGGTAVSDTGRASHPDARRTAGHDGWWPRLSDNHDPRRRTVDFGAEWQRNQHGYPF